MWDKCGESANRCQWAEHICFVLLPNKFEPWTAINRLTHRLQQFPLALSHFSTSITFMFIIYIIVHDKRDRASIEVIWYICVFPVMLMHSAVVKVSCVRQQVNRSFIQKKSKDVHHFLDVKTRIKFVCLNGVTLFRMLKSLTGLNLPAFLFANTWY